MLESLYSNKQKILKNSQEFFSNSSSDLIKIGCELEFFLLNQKMQSLENKEQIQDLILELDEKLKKNFSLIYEAQKEQGTSQVEIKTSFTPHLKQLCEELEDSKKFIKDFAQKKNLIASFAAQPFVNDCGSSLQFNISLHENEKNLFDDEKKISQTSAKLLENTDFMMIFLAPKKEDYQRFSFEINRTLFKKGKFTAPVNLSFGADNRTCAIRVVNRQSSVISHRLEYRIAAADADAALCISAILLSLSQNQKKQDFPQIFGNAFDEQYKLKKFCQSLTEAEEKFFAEENFIRNIFKKIFI
jgi:glutamine synthetase